MATKKQKERRQRIKELFAAMAPIEGEVRVVYACGDCGHLFGRRFIPYAVGRGLTIDPCLCQITAHRPMNEVSRKKP